MVGSNPEGKQKPKKSQRSPDVSTSDHRLSCAALQPTGLCSLFCKPWGTLGSSTGHLRKIKSPVQGQHCLSVRSLSAFPRQPTIMPKSGSFEATRQHKKKGLFLKTFSQINYALLLNDEGPVPVHHQTVTSAQGGIPDRPGWPSTMTQGHFPIYQSLEQGAVKNCTEKRAVSKVLAVARSSSRPVPRGAALSPRGQAL